MKKIILVFAFITAAAVSFAASANVYVDYNNNLHSFFRDKAFGTNALGEWTDLKLYRDNIYRFQQAGTRFLRFPGGSNSNEYHWNGSGYYDADKVWHVNGSPNVTAFQRGFYNLAEHRGSLSKGYGKWAMVTDGDLNTYWLSYRDDFDSQWIYIDLQDASYIGKNVNRIVIDWGTPYASQFKIQYSNGNWNGLGTWAYNDTAWTDTSAGIIAGTGALSDISFTLVNAKYVRVKCLTSSDVHNQYAIKEIKLFNGTTQLTLNQANVNQSPSVSSSVGLGDKFNEFDTVDFEQFMSICKSLTPSAEPMITINFFTGTPQEAADWVYYANVHKGYGIKYWEIGNENAGNWEAGGPAGPISYAKRFLAMYDAMTAVDNTIIIAPQFNTIRDVANVTMTAGNNPGAYDYYIDVFLKYLQDNGRADILKGLSVHRYPTWMPASEAVPLAQVDLWDSDLPLLKSWINSRCSLPAQVDIWLSEYNDGIDSAFTNHFSNSLFVTAFTLNYLKNGGDFTFFFRPFGTPGPGQTDLTIFSDFGYLEGGGLTGMLSDNRYQPRSSFYAFEIMYNRFSAADVFGNTIVHASSDSSSLKVYANKRGDRKLSLMLINTGNTEIMNAAITINGFTPLSSAETVTYDSSMYSWIPNGSQSYASPDMPPVIAALAGVSANFVYNVPPYSIKVITMYDSAQATLVPSNTPTMLPTPTITPTPLPNGGVMIDDCDDGDLNNMWGGTWSIYGDTVSSYPAALTAMTCDGAGVPGLNCYMAVTGTVNLNMWGYGVNIPLNPIWGPTDVSMYDGIFFWYKSDGTPGRLGCVQSDMSDSNYGLDVSGNTFWAYYTIPFSSLTHSAWGNPAGVWTGTNIRAIQMQVNGGYGGAGYREVALDNIGFYKNTPTFTVTPTVTFTLTATRTASVTVTFTRTAQNTLSNTPTAIPSAVNTATGTPSSTPTMTPEHTLKNNLDRLYVSPSPFNAGSGDNVLCFYNLTSHFALTLYNIKGEKVYEKETDTSDGVYCVNLSAQRMRVRVASGIYVYIVDDGNGSRKVGKLAIVR